MNHIYDLLVPHCAEARCYIDVSGARRWKCTHWEPWLTFIDDGETQETEQREEVVA